MFLSLIICYDYKVRSEGHFPDRSDDSGREYEEVDARHDGVREEPAGVLFCDCHHPCESCDHGKDASSSHDDWHQQEVYRYYFQHVDPIEPH